MGRHPPVPKSRSMPALSIGSDWCPFISTWRTSFVTNSTSRGEGTEMYSSTKRAAASLRELLATKAQRIQWCESFVRNTRLTFDQTIEGGKPSPQ